MSLFYFRTNFSKPTSPIQFVEQARYSLKSTHRPPELLKLLFIHLLHFEVTLVECHKLNGQPGQYVHLISGNASDWYSFIEKIVQNASKEFYPPHIESRRAINGIILHCDSILTFSQICILRMRFKLKYVF